jgi:BASS family bile acid:Na+ symporter
LHSGLCVLHELKPVVTILAALYLISMMFSLGLELGGGEKESKVEKHAERRMLIRGLILNLAVVPALTFVVARLLHTSSDVTIALLLLVCAPGGRFAPHLVKLGKGNMALGVELTLFLAKLTAFTAPPAAKYLLTLHTMEVRELPFVVQLVALQLVPFFGGKWLRRKHSPVADALLRPARVASIATALLCLAVVLIKEDRGILDLIRDRGWLAVLIVTLLVPLIAWWVGGPREKDRRALAITVNSRELALALVMASLAFPERGVHTALFGIWTLTAFASFALASGIRAASSDAVRGGGQAPAGRGEAHSGAAR